MNYVIAIPTSEREDMINNHTLAFLRSHKIDTERIFLFINKDEIPNYERKLAQYKYKYNIIEGGTGIQKQREAISNYFDNGQYIVSLDDDIRNIYCHDYLPRTGKSKLRKINCFESLILNTGELLEKENCSLCGVYPVQNPFYMKNKYTNNLKFCIGQCRFFINDRFCEKRNFNLLEDYETTIKYYLKDNKVLRHENICTDGDYKVVKWGLEFSDKIFEQKLFLDKYKKFCFLKRKSNGNEDIQMRTKITRDVLSTLWIGKQLNELSLLSIKSWIKNGYNVDLYIDSDLFEFDLFPKNLRDYVTFCQAKDIMDYNTIDDILPLSDLWRYQLLIKRPNSIWIDADMVLLDRLPLNKECIISSEHSFQSGAYKSKDTKKPNIGILKLGSQHNEILKDLVKKNRLYTDYEFTDLMIKFQKLLKTTKYKYLNKYVAEPSLYCPVPWWNADEIYYNKTYRTKYNVKVQTNEDILNNSIGIHMWNNFTYNKHMIDFDIIQRYSLFDLLQNRFS